MASGDTTDGKKGKPNETRSTRTDDEKINFRAIQSKHKVKKCNKVKKSDRC